eukprot:32091-Chlamydomonas_euryale.AAC.1
MQPTVLSLAGPTQEHQPRAHLRAPSPARPRRAACARGLREPFVARGVGGAARCSSCCAYERGSELSRMTAAERGAL